MEAIGIVERWNTRRLVELMPGTTRAWWRDRIPQLESDGVLKRDAPRDHRGWFGTRESILAAVTGANGQHPDSSR